VTDHTVLQSDRMQKWLVESDLLWHVMTKVVLSKSGPPRPLLAAKVSPQTTFGCQNWSPLLNTVPLFETMFFVSC